MSVDRGKIRGILGAIIIHLVAAIIFMLVKLGSLRTNEVTKEYQIALEDLSEPAKKEILTDHYGTSVEKIFQGDQEVLNIARNLANQPDVKINAADYIDKVKDELIESGKLGKDNYIDEQKKAKESRNNENDISAQKDNNLKAQEKKDEANKMAANYAGPTRIYYNLKGRYQTYLNIPIYKCEGSGKIVMNIEVNQKGDVLNAKVLPAESTTTDPCLIETAVNAALISRFNPDAFAEKVQMGTLTYHFVSQK
jgi:hypothetical protein